MPIVLNLEDSKIEKLDDKNYLYRPANIKNFEEWTNNKKPHSYLIQHDIYEMFQSIPAPKKNRKMSTSSTDSVVQMFEDL